MQIGQGRQQVGRANDLFRNLTGFNDCRPANEKRNAMPGFPEAALQATEPA